MKVLVPLARPSLAAEDLQGIHEVLVSGQLVQAQQVLGFEAELAAVHEVAPAQVIAVTNGSVALHVALLALELPAGSSVVMPAFTFPSVANVVELCGYRSEFVDISLDDFAPDPEVFVCASKAANAAVWVHQFGIVPGDAEALHAVEAAGVPVIEDAACALGTRFGGRAAGAHASLGCSSFHPRKLITTGEGGLVIARDLAVAERARSLRNHGQRPGETGPLRFERAGMNARMGEMNAAIGRSQLRKLPYFLEKRHTRRRLYLELLAGVGGVTIPAAYRDQARSNVQSFVVVLDEGIDRARVIAELRAAGIETTLGGYSIPHQPYYEKRYGAPGGRFPNADRAFRQALALPMYPDLADDQVRLVVETLSEVL